MSGSEGTCSNQRQDSEINCEWGLEREKWLKAEFEQSFLQLRDHNNRINQVVYWFVGAVLAAISAKLGMKSMGDDFLSGWLLSLLLFLFGLFGFGSVAWILSLRTSFVIYARQVNRIRRYYIKKYELADVVFPGWDPRKPRWLHHTSSDTYFICVSYVMSFASIILSVLTFPFEEICSHGCFICFRTPLVTGLVIGISIYSWIYREAKRKALCNMYRSPLR